MDSKPLITYAGDATLCASLQFGVCQGLPVESVEWRRSFGRPPKKVYVECNFVQFGEELLPKDKDWKLLGQAFLHTFWTDCVDVDQYKAYVRDDIIKWLTILKNRGIHDWLIVSVETMDNRKINKTKLLPRASVMDKIRSDFCSSSPDRCVTLLDPLKSDARGAESWQGLLQGIRQLLLEAYNRYLNKFEEYMRLQREKRNEAGWSFCEYFLLQEELAFVFEMLGIYDESLVQYDELDALFTQFVLNSTVGDTPEWLNRFSRTCDKWRGLSLVQTVDQQSRELIGSGKASLLELRNYLFSRQCALLLFLCRPWEVAQRTLPILHNCINELHILEVSMPPGAVSCWVFLSCLEVLQTCERFNDSGQVEAYSLYTAGLWAYARDKLQELGVMCGLMPGLTPSSEQLHTVVMLISGMEDDGPDRGPVVKLKEALSSKESFQRHYLELSELAMGTFKHISRIRSARLIGKDLANFYMMLNEPHKAAAFLSDIHKTCIREGWITLASDAQKELVRCYKAMNDCEKCIKICAQMAACNCLEKSLRVYHFDEMLSLVKQVRRESPILISAKEILKLKSLSLVADSDVIICETNLTLTVEVESLLVKELLFDTISLSVQHVTVDQPSTDGQHSANPGSKGDTRFRDQSPSSHFSVQNLAVRLVEHYDRKHDHTLNAASLVCTNSHAFMRRRDSQYGLNKEKDLAKKEAVYCIIVKDIRIVPGKNVLKFCCKAGKPGRYLVSQLFFKTSLLEFLFPNLEPELTYVTVCETPQVFLQRATRGDLVAGAEQELILTVHSGSFSVEPETTIRLQASKGLLLKVEDDGEEHPAFMQSVECVVPTVGPFQTALCKVKVLAEVVSLRGGGSFERRVNIISPWSMEKLTAQLVFVLPFSAQHRLHTAGPRKFVQVIMQGLQAEEFELFDHSVTFLNHADVEVIPQNPLDQHLVICKDQNASYLWELVNNISESPSLSFEFSVNYARRESDRNSEKTKLQTTFRHQFELSNYKTLFTIRSKIEPIGSEFCRMGSICHMNITFLCDVPTEPMPSLMYEVLTDQMSWAVCGRTAGILSVIADGQCSITLDVMPLARGFLPLPSVRLSKYIPADCKATAKDSPKKVEIPQYPRLEPFAQGQVFNMTKAIQIHVLPALGANVATDAVNS